MDLYTLEGVAYATGNSYDYVRTVVNKLERAGEKMEWKGFKFQKLPGRVWVAVPKTKRLNVIDGPPEQAPES
jgi:hypothetical protein